MSYLVFFTFNSLIFLISFIKIGKVVKITSFFFLFCLILYFIKIDFYSDLIAYKENIEGDSTLTLEVGWEAITREIFSIINNSNYVLLIIMLLNVTLSLNLVSFLNLNKLDSIAFSLFLFTKWFLYLFVVIRFGLASLIMLNLLVYYDDCKKKPLLFYLGCLFACLLHYSIMILIILLIFFNIKKKSTKVVVLCFSAIPIYYFYNKVMQLDSRILRYFVADGFETNYNLIHVLIMLSFSAILLYNYLKKEKPQELLVLSVLAIMNIILQPFDAVNRIIYVLIIYFLFKSVKYKFLNDITSIYLILLSIVYVLRYSIFAPIDKSLLF